MGVNRKREVWKAEMKERMEVNRREERKRRREKRNEGQG